MSPARHYARLAVLFAALEAFLVLYPPIVERLIPNYYIHFEIWIPLGIALNLGLAYWGIKRRPTRTDGAGSTDS